MSNHGNQSKSQNLVAETTRKIFLSRTWSHIEGQIWKKNNRHFIATEPAYAARDDWRIASYPYEKTVTRIFHASGHWIPTEVTMFSSSLTLGSQSNHCACYVQTWSAFQQMPCCPQSKQRVVTAEHSSMTANVHLKITTDLKTDPENDSSARSIWSHVY